MIRFFKHSFFPQYITLFLLTVLLWIPAFITPAREFDFEKSFTSPLYFTFLAYFSNNHLLMTLFHFLLVFSNAILANYILEKNDLIPRNSLLAAFFFILLLSQIDFSHNNPGYIVTFLLLIMLFYLLGIYKINEPYIQVFNSGLLISIASFIYFPSVIFLLFVWIIFVIYRHYYWREWVILLIGALTLYILIWTYYFLFDQLGEAFYNYSTFFSFNLTFEHWSVFSIPKIIIYIMVILLFLWSLLKILAHYGERILIVRKRVSVLIWFFLMMFISLLFSGFDLLTHQVMIMAGMSLLIGVGVSYARKLIWLEIIISGLTVLILMEKYLILVL
jgi:hypothetical protein